MTVEINLWNLFLFASAFLLLALGGHFVGFRYWLQLWYGIDVTLNAATFGDVHETISSRWGKAIKRGNRLAIWVAKATFLTRHFEESIDEDVGHKRIPVAMGVVGIVWIVVLFVAFAVVRQG